MGCLYEVKKDGEREAQAQEAFFAHLNGVTLVDVTRQRSTLAELLAV